MVKWPFSRKPWEKYLCTFVLQQFGASGDTGWADVTDPTGEVPTKEEAHDLFKPGRSYQCMARYADGPKAGQFAGVVWRWFEPFPGGLKPKEVKPKQPREKEVPETMKFSDIIRGYTAEVDEVLAPMTQLAATFGKIRESFGIGGGGQGSPYGISAPEFEGKIPILFHPYIIETIGKEVRATMEYGFKKLEKITGVPAGEEAEEEEELVLPKPSAYRREAPTTPEVKKPTPLKREEITEEGEEELEEEAGEGEEEEPEEEEETGEE